MLIVNIDEFFELFLLTPWWAPKCSYVGYLDEVS